MFIKFDGDEARIPLQKILTYLPDHESTIPTLKLFIDSSPPEEREITFNSPEELANAVQNLDHLCSVINIPIDRDMVFNNPEGSDDQGEGALSIH
jgi:hypothetical protein